MYTAWSNHLKDPDDKYKFEEYVYRSRALLDRLKDILENYEQNIETNELNPDNYSIANWAFKQADSNGFKRCLRTIKKLIDLDYQNPPTKENTE